MQLWTNYSLDNVIIHSLPEEKARLGLHTKLNRGLYINGGLIRNQSRFCHFKTFLHPPSPPSISCLQHVYWGIACKPYHNPRLNINYALSGHWQITGISGCAFVLACTQIKSACKVTIIKVSQGEGEESRGIITGGSGYLSSQGSHWEKPPCMPFTPQKRDGANLALGQSHPLQRPKQCLILSFPCSW